MAFLVNNRFELKLFLVILFCFDVSFCYVTNLNGIWTVSNSNGSYNLTGKVPGTIYTDLLRSKIIDDPYYRFNDEKYRWVSYENWTYSRTFTVSSDVLNFSKISLVCNGLDTISKIVLNDKIVGTSDNMFIRYDFDIKSILKEGENHIQVSFTSPIKYAEAKFKAHSDYVVPPVCSPPEQHGECYRNYIRKEQASFSWDWGPAFPTMGIWKNISIEYYNYLKIEDILVTTERGCDLYPWVMNIKIAVNVVSSKLPLYYLIIRFVEIPVFQKKELKFVLGYNQFDVQFNLSKDYDVKPWWPNGIGNQTLYNLDFIFIGEEVVNRHVRVGFRTVELIQEKVDNSTGLTFYFKINGMSIFLKGANWIPADSFKERITNDYLRWLLQSAVDANMNALRVWGGGVYETEEFYDMTDELGLLVWQDMMFACSMYPVNPEFLKSVQQEVSFQIRRLQNHPSIIAWSGNNENEAALAGNWYMTKSRFELYKKDYITLYIDTIKSLVESIDTSRPFISSSPTNGKKTETEGWVAKDPTDPLYGDVHYYNYLADGWNASTFPRTRFTSEYGYQSWPSFETFQNVSIKKDWNPYSTFLSHRQHHLLGDYQMLLEILHHFKLPFPQSTFSAFIGNIYLSQINQAMSIKTETEFYRRSQTDLIKGYGKTMGALYWQLNDIWQAPSWSSIEYGGKWKMLHYFANEFFSPILASSYVENDIFKVFIISDLTNSINVTLSIEVFAWTSFKPLKTLTVDIHQSSQSSQEVFSQKMDDLFKTSNCQNQNSCFIYLTLSDSFGQVGPNNYYFPVSFDKVTGLKKPNLTISSVKKESANIFSYTLSTTSISPFTWVEATGIQGRFCCNGFLLVKPQLNMVFYARGDDITENDFSQSLHVQSFLDIYI